MKLKYKYLILVLFLVVTGWVVGERLIKNHKNIDIAGVPIACSKKDEFNNCYQFPIPKLNKRVLLALYIQGLSPDMDGKEINMKLVYNKLSVDYHFIARMMKDAQGKDICLIFSGESFKSDGMLRLEVYNVISINSVEANCVFGN